MKKDKLLGQKETKSAVRIFQHFDGSHAFGDEQLEMAVPTENQFCLQSTSTKNVETWYPVNEETWERTATEWARLPSK